MKKLLFLVTLLIANFANSQETWFPLGPDDFNQPTFGKVNYSKISHDNNNVPYIAFSDKTSFKICITLTISIFENTVFSI